MCKKKSPESCQSREYLITSYNELIFITRYLTIIVTLISPILPLAPPLGGGREGGGCNKTMVEL